MKSRFLLLSVLVPALIMFSSCGGSQEKKDYEAAQKSRDIQQMQNFINSYPEGQYAMDMGKEIEKTEFESCETVFDYEAFAEKYPQSVFLRDASYRKAAQAIGDIRAVLDKNAVDAVLAEVAMTPAEPVAEDETATIETPFGKMTVRFFTEEAPNHAANFKRLAKAGYYNGTTFHRIIPGFVIQGGDILSRDDNRNNDGTGGPGYTVDAEFNSIHHRMGILSMARAMDPNSAGSQFFVCAGDIPHLDNKYTVFGEVTEGLEVIERIVNQPRDQRDNPKAAIPMYVYMN